MMTFRAQPIPLPEMSLELSGQPLHVRSRGVVAAPVGGPPLAEYVRVDLQFDIKIIECRVTMVVSNL